MEEDEAAGLTPEECRDRGLWEVDLVYYSVNGNNKEHSKNKRGKAYRARSNSEYKCFESHDGVMYRPGDHVYIEISQFEPYGIGTIVNFKMTKRDQLSVKIMRYYRPEDVPEDSYSLLVQERQDDNSLNHRALAAMQIREIFTTEVQTVFPICQLRGKCIVRPIKDIRALGICDVQSLTSDTFFCYASFDPNNSRLAPVQGEIRVGELYQAVIPSLETSSAYDEPDRDVLEWRPGYIDLESEHRFTRAARTFRMFAMMRMADVIDVERQARSSDLCTYNALTMLHNCRYNVSHAIEEMQKHDKKVIGETKFMSAEDMRKFARGIKMYGKNFLKIKKELLAHHERDELVQFYYTWKKLPDVPRPKPLARSRNVNAVTYRRNKNNQAKASRAGSTDLADYPSASETEMDELMNDGRGAAYACHHCYSTESKDWHHSNKDRQLLCTECRIFYKKYGQLRSVDRPSTVPPSLHKQKSPEVIEDSDLGVRTRAGKKERRGTPNERDKKNSSPLYSGLTNEPRQRNGKRKSRVELLNGLPRKRGHQDFKEVTNVASEVPVNDGSCKENLTNGESLQNGVVVVKEETEEIEAEPEKVEQIVQKVSTSPFEDSRERNGECNSKSAIKTASLELSLNSLSETSESSHVSTDSMSVQKDNSISAESEEKQEKLLNGFAKDLIGCEKQPSTSFAKFDETLSLEEQKKKAEEENEIRRATTYEKNWSLGSSVALTTTSGRFILRIERFDNSSCARTDLVFQAQEKKKEVRQSISIKNHIYSNAPRKSTESTMNAVTLLSSSGTAALIPPNSQSSEIFMGGRIPLNGAMVGGVPPIPSLADPRLSYLSAQQQYALALEQQQALHKQYQQQLRAHHPLDCFRNGANGTITPNSMRDTPSQGSVTAHGIPPGMIPQAYHGLNMDHHSLSYLLHNPQMNHFGVGMDNHATAVMMTAFEQRMLEQQQRMLIGAPGVDMMGHGSMSGSQDAPANHMHPHASLMQQAAAAAAVSAASQPNNEAMHLQILAMAQAQAQAAHRSFIEPNQLLQMSLMNSFNNDLVNRVGGASSAANSEMMRRLQQEGGFAHSQRS